MHGETLSWSASIPARPTASSRCSLDRLRLSRVAIVGNYAIAHAKLCDRSKPRTQGLAELKTDDAIISSASRHFAEAGFDGASLRAILRDANVNAAAGHYHFGSKEAVYRATIERYLVPLMEERRQVFEGLDLSSDNKQTNLRLLIRAYVTPHLRLCENPEAHPYLSIIARFGTEQRPLVQSIYQDIIHPVRKLYLQALCDIIQTLDLDTTRRLFGWVASIMGNSPFELNYESMSGHSAMPDDVDALIDRVVAMSSGGILAVAESFERQP